MKKLFLFTVVVFSLTAAVSAQVSNAAITAGVKRFPGVSRADMEQLLAAKRVMGIALPTWVPAGFKVERIKSRVGRGVSLDDREFVVLYSRKLASGKVQRFSLEAGFDGLGDLMYEGPTTVRAPVGKIYLYYQPKDEDGKKLTDFSMTEWISVGKNAFSFDGMPKEQEEVDPDQVMISKVDTEKILRSLTRL